ncbi:MAG: trypsin-like peptidase domain-containing protein [Firmicutes bacterium]|nr:trypsin-like peptidase domain-containing protein [Bacillota bacterium]MCL5057442.1 trypsin-like peptidase domain-containing protein [Actinomycetota bacterium]
MNPDDMDKIQPEENAGSAENEETMDSAVNEEGDDPDGHEEETGAPGPWQAAGAAVVATAVPDRSKYSIRPGKKRYTAAFIIAAFVLGVALASAAFYFVPILPSLAESGHATAIQASTAVPDVNPAGAGSIADIVDKTSPAVVKIQTTIQSGGNSRDPFANDPFFRQFFGNRVPLNSGPSVAKGMGSGFIISEDGYILTNEHVIEGATQIEVRMSGKDEPVPAKLVGADAELDLAVLKISGQNGLPTLQLGDSNSVRVGEWAIAIGNPQGLDHTVTIGVISAKGRPITVQDKQYKNLLQTDASINPGNSGGPLLNMSGQVIGINTAVNASAQGIGFAIPTSTVQPVLDTLISKGKIARPWLGVNIQSLNKEIADYMKLDRTEGALVTSVVNGGPAAAAGIVQGDVITELDHQSVATAGDLTGLVEKMKPNQKVVAVVYREGKKMLINVVIGEKGNIDG